MRKRIIISGGGIAGLTAAKLLQRQGHQLIVLDKAQEFTPAGFLLSLKSFGVTFMDEFGLGRNLRDASTPSECMNFLDAEGHLIRSVSYRKAYGMNSPASILISRGGLHHVLYQTVKHDVNIRFNASIEAVRQDGQTVSVTLSDGERMDADVLIVSEGLRSTTRTKYVENSHVEDFNVFYVGGRLKQAHAYPVGTFSTFVDVNKMLSIYPISRDELAIQCYVHTTDETTRLPAGTHHLLKETFRDYSTAVRHLIDDFIQRGQVYADKMGMVHAPDLVNGNMVLLGDAGYCPTPLSGMGASLSIYGAAALAHFTAQSPDDIRLATRRYNSLMQPIIGQFQNNARRNAESFLPKSKAELAHFKTAFGTAPEPALFKRLTDQLALTDEQLRFGQP